MTGKLDDINPLVRSFMRILNFDYAFYAQSPEFTTLKSDMLIQVIDEYINFEGY